MSPSSHRRLLQEQMQQATIKRRLAQAAAKKAGGMTFPQLMAVIEAQAHAAVRAATDPAEAPVRH
jgi:hypothetical protein